MAGEAGCAASAAVLYMLILSSYTWSIFLGLEFFIRYYLVFVRFGWLARLASFPSAAAFSTRESRPIRTRLRGANLSVLPLAVSLSLWFASPSFFQRGDGL